VLDFQFILSDEQFQVPSKTYIVEYREKANKKEDPIEMIGFRNII